MTKSTALAITLTLLAPVGVGALAMSFDTGAEVTLRTGALPLADIEAPATVTTDTASTVADSSIARAEREPVVPMAADDVEDAAPSTEQVRRAEAPSSGIGDPLAPVTSPDAGEHCATGLDASEITEFFSHPIGEFQGADYQRAFRLADDRVLWAFQDAFIGGTLVHNVGMIQSGRCFTMLNDAARSWLLGDATSHMRQWHWILSGGMGADGTRLHLYVVQMNETGTSYLSRTRPSALRRVVLDIDTFEVVEMIDEPTTGGDLYGWGVTSDADYTYLYSHCYQQFGYDTMLGFGECAADARLARVPLGQFDVEPEYWDGAGWNADRAVAEPVVSTSFAGSGNNPVQITNDGTRFVLVQKSADWWGTTVDFGVSDDPHGPFVHSGSIDEPLKCDPSVCNTYFASWIPWNDSNGNHIWSISHNRWNGSETSSHLAIYRPTFLTVSSSDLFDEVLPGTESFIIEIGAR